MCRFLIVRSKKKLKPENLLRQFASMCEKSHAPEGDWQGDGWGIATKVQSSKFKVQNWKIYTSLNPIWKDEDKFKQFGETDSFIIHARSAGFPQQKGIIEYNQPYISGSLCFVFNGMIKGVNIKRKLEGKIGAQKIFSLILQERKNKSLDQTLKMIDRLMIENSQEIIGMNIGATDGNKFYILCQYKDKNEYFGVRYYQDDVITVVCSAPIGSFDWKVMGKGEVLII